MDEFDLIETPENVELQRRLAGIGSRFLAGIVDALLILVLYALILLAWSLFALASPFAYITEARFVASWAFAVIIFVMFLIYWGYFMIFEILLNGQSPGKRIMKIRVMKEGGSAITFSDIFIRNLLRAADWLPFGYGVGVVCMFLSKKVQRLGDLAAGTVVISEQVLDYAARGDGTRALWTKEVTAPALRATGLNPEEYRALSNYWLRRQQLSLAARGQLLPRLLRPILQRAGQTLPDQSLEALEAYVQTLMAKAVEAEAAPPPQATSPEATP